MFPDGNGNQLWTYTPDGLPATVNTWNNGGTTVLTNSYVYNNRRLLTGESIAQPGWYTWGLGYGYDANGTLASQSYPTGLIIAYAPNALGQATQAGPYATGVQYHPNGAIKQFTYGNGLVHTMVQNARQLPYSSTDSGGALSQQYNYDANGNVEAILDSLDGARNRWMGYDELDRLTMAASASFGGSDHTHRFTYDALDNLRSWKHPGVKDFANYDYDVNQRLTGLRNTGGTALHTMAYDVQGNVTSKDSQGFTFDYGNRLRATTGTGAESYRYDAYGRRVQTTQTASGARTLWQYAQNGQLMFSSKLPVGGGQTTHENVYLGGSLVAIIDHDWPSNAITGLKYQHTDALGSPVAETNASGVVTNRIKYDPYGGSIGTAVNGMGYTGHVMDAGTGLTYMQQRYYDPQIGRFLSIDPIMSDIQSGWNFNRYNYAANNPYAFTDPDGRQICRRTIGENCYVPPPMPAHWGGGGSGDFQLGGSAKPSARNESKAKKASAYDVGESADGCGGLDDYCGPQWRDGSNLREALLWSAGGGVAAEAQLIYRTGKQGLKAGTGAAAATWKNISFDGPNGGGKHLNGRLFGARWKGGVYGVRLDLHEIRKYGPRPVLHINYGPSNLPESKQGHLILFDFNKLPW
ncbi:RHS repeat domain-containing protein [Arenimonas sp. MALMAid1274]|uniref:RHS repeat domain-containing protein n=1 Tax=Arenimonas sp. MALMAid1274 TaxID=3411630 RepID=UPI003BA34718